MKNLTATGYRIALSVWFNASRAASSGASLKNGSVPSILAAQNRLG
jgi:hypothetical protein